MSRLHSFLLAGLLCIGLSAPRAQPAAVAPTEQQVKAVFVFNFSHFVAWPAGSLAAPAEPFVIGVLGGDGMAAQIEQAVRGERVENHPIEVRRLAGIEDLDDCQILYIDRSRGSDLERVLSQLDRRSTLTVSDLEGAARRGVMIELAREGNRIRLLINVEAARSGNLTISSNLLRPARIVRSSN